MRVRRGRSIRTGLILVLTTIAALVAAAAAQAADPQGATPPGFVIEKWIPAQIRPFYERPASADLSDCQAGQSRKLWILGPQQPDENRQVHCTIPAGTPIFLSGPWGACSTAEPWPYHGDTDAELLRCAETFWRSQFVSAAVFIDGVKVPQLSRFIRSSEVFTANVVPGNAFGAEPGPARLAAKGVFLYVAPLAPGTHVIRGSGLYRSSGGGVVEYLITVR